MSQTVTGVAPNAGVARRADRGSERSVHADLVAISLSIALPTLITMVVPLFAGVLVATSVNLLALYFLRNRFAPRVVSPTLMLCGFLTLIGLSGFFFVNPLAGAGGTSGIENVLSDDLLVKTSGLFLWSSTIILVIAACFQSKRSASFGSTERNLLDFGDISRFAPVILVGVTIELIAAIALSGVTDLLQRETYLYAAGAGSAGTIAQMLALAAITLTGVVAFSTRGILRFLGVALIIAFSLYFIALGTRRLALIPILLFLSHVVARRGKVSFLALIATIVLCTIGLVYSLHIRGLPSHGLIPHLGGLSSFSINASDLATSVNNVLVGYRITALTAFVEPTFPAHYFFVSISPLDGGTLNWPTISRELRLNRNTPYSSIGEIANQGTLVWLASAMSIGAAFGSIEAMNRKSFSVQATKIFGFITVGLLFLFVIQSIQYNFRSITRFVYLAFAVQILSHVILARLGRSHSRSEAERDFVDSDPTSDARKNAADRSE